MNEIPEYAKKWVLKKHYNDEEEYKKLYNEFYENNGKCYIYSFILFQKLSKIGAKRCRGTINNPSLIRRSKINQQVCHHVWVETDNMVYDKSILRTIIAPKEEWYEFYQISDVEYADYGIFNKNNYKLNSGPDDIDELKKHLLKKSSFRQIVI
jgi:hypothetical protein